MFAYLQKIFLTALLALTFFASFSFIFSEFTTTYLLGPLAEAATKSSPKKCTLDGVTVSHNESRKFYSRNLVLFGQECKTFAETRTCKDGTLSGAAKYKFSTCTALLPKDCTVKGVTVSHNKSRKFYSKSSVLFGQECKTFAETRSCTNGILSGAAKYKFPTCAAEK